MRPDDLGASEAHCFAAKLLSSVPVTAGLTRLQAQPCLELDHSLYLTLGHGAQLFLGSGRGAPVYTLLRKPSGFHVTF